MESGLYREFVWIRSGLGRLFVGITEEKLETAIREGEVLRVYEIKFSHTSRRYPLLGGSGDLISR